MNFDDLTTHAKSHCSIQWVNEHRIQIARTMDDFVSSGLDKNDVHEGVEEALRNAFHSKSFALADLLMDHIALPRVQHFVEYGFDAFDDDSYNDTNEYEINGLEDLILKHMGRVPPEQQRDTLEYLLSSPVGYTPSACSFVGKILANMDWDVVDRQQTDENYWSMSALVLNLCEGPDRNWMLDLLARHHADILVEAARLVLQLQLQGGVVPSVERRAVMNHQLLSRIPLEMLEPLYNMYTTIKELNPSVIVPNELVQWKLSQMVETGGASAPKTVKKM